MSFLGIYSYNNKRNHPVCGRRAGNKNYGGEDIISR
jgi:hypothetical protein